MIKPPGYDIETYRVGSLLCVVHLGVHGTLRIKNEALLSLCSRSAPNAAKKY